MTDPAALRRYTRGVLRARWAYACDRAYADRRCICGRRLETTARTCRPCRRARTQPKETP